MGARAGLDDYGEEENLLPVPEFKSRNVRPRLVAIPSMLSGYTTTAVAANADAAASAAATAATAAAASATAANNNNNKLSR